MVEILLDQVEIAIAVQVAELAFMSADAIEDESGLEAAASVAVVRKLAAGWPGRG